MAKPHRSLYHPQISSEYVATLTEADMTERFIYTTNKGKFWRGSKLSARDPKGYWIVILFPLSLLLLCSCSHTPISKPASMALKSGMTHNPRYEWNYYGPGPVWFEVWHCTNFTQFTWSGDTNVPNGFELFSTTDKTNGPIISVPIVLDKPFECFIVRAVNEFGPGPWVR